MTRRTGCRFATVALLGLVLGNPPACLGAEAGLRHDPFIRPQFVPGSSSPVGRQPSADAPAAPEAAPAWQTDLRGVMLAGKGSVANVGGTIVALGATLDGWRLSQVGDGTAVFEKAGRRLLITMNNPGLQK